MGKDVVQPLLTICIRIVVKKLLNEVWKREVGKEIQEIGGIRLCNRDHPEKSSRSGEERGTEIRMIDSRIKTIKDQDDIDFEDD